MITKKEAVEVLKINGVPIDSPDDYIKSILFSARYTEDEVNYAINALRNKESSDEVVARNSSDGLYKIFRSDGSLKPDEITRLLGIEVEQKDIILASKKRHTISTQQLIMMWSASFLLAGIGILVYMYVLQVGVFHPSVTLTMQ